MPSESAPCRTAGCSTEVKSPYVFCFKCNKERKKLMTAKCAVCDRAINPEYPTCYPCNQRKREEEKIAPRYNPFL